MNYETIGKKWIHPTTGEVRYYVNQAWKYGGLELDFYNTGNICNATIDGEQTSNRLGGKLKNAIEKCWITEDGEVHFKSHGEEWFVEKVKAGIRKALTEVM